LQPDSQPFFEDAAKENAIDHNYEQTNYANNFVGCTNAVCPIESLGRGIKFGVSKIYRGT
jgi:hypothetical protein